MQFWERCEIQFQVRQNPLGSKLHVWKWALAFFRKVSQLTGSETKNDLLVWFYLLLILAKKVHIRLILNENIAQVRILSLRQIFQFCMDRMLLDNKRFGVSIKDCFRPKLMLRFFCTRHVRAHQIGLTFVSNSKMCDEKLFSLRRFLS